MVLRGLAKTRPHRPLRLGAALVRVTLAPEVADALWTAAEVMSEGEVRAPLGAAPDESADPPPPVETYYGSTMITVPLDRLAHALGVASIGHDELGVLVQLLGHSALVRARIARVARREAKSRVPGRPLGCAHTETRMRVVSGRLEIDVDLEAALDADIDPRRKHA